MIDQLMERSRPDVARRVWVMSDLQQSDPASARRCMTTAVRDFEKLALPCDAIWYLGDAVEGHRLEFLEDMAKMQVELLAPLNIPLRYVLGNHDFDHTTRQGNTGQAIRMPFWEAIKQQPGWRTIDTLEQWWWSEDLGDWTIFFFSDHADPHGRWICTHGQVQRDIAAYPYGPEAYADVRAKIAACPNRVITCGHLAFPGGNRPADMMARLLPLPDNVKLHFYGHAHIGDLHWAGKHVNRKIAYVDYQKVPQIDVASLEDQRGSAVRSVILEFYRDHSLGLWFRNHTRGAWDEGFVLSDSR